MNLIVWLANNEVHFYYDKTYKKQQYMKKRELLLLMIEILKNPNFKQTRNMMYRKE